MCERDLVVDPPYSESELGIAGFLFDAALRLQFNVFGTRQGPAVQLS
jgi:hypothetical protein